MYVCEELNFQFTMDEVRSVISINTNLASINAIRKTEGSTVSIQTSMQRLSSGLRINSAGDDAAGMAISSRFTSQIRGMDQAYRNINDGVSMAKTVEGALGEVSGMLHRMRELSIQAANSTLSSSDRRASQNEVNQLVSEVERIASTTAFNNVKVFGDDRGSAILVDAEGAPSGDNVITSSDPLRAEKEQILENLQRSWLQQSEGIISEYFGINAPNVELEVFLDDEISFATAYVSGSAGSENTTLVNLQLHIDVEELISIGTEWPSELDQLVAHEMTHAVMDATMNVVDFDKWFMEGTAEFLPGGDNRLAGVLAGAVGEGAAKTTADIAANIANITGDSFSGSHFDYATAYSAVSFLHDSLINNEGMAGGVKDMMAYLTADSTRTLDDFFTDQTSYANRAAFVTDFQTNGAAFLDARVAAGELANADTGAIGGADADGGVRITSSTGTIPDIDSFTTDPLAGFVEIYPTFSKQKLLLSSSLQISFQVGSESGHTIDTSLRSVHASSLGIDDIDLVDNAQKAIGKLDLAMDAINSERARLGAIQNRMESASEVALVISENASISRSRIMDTDYAMEMATFTKTQIIQQAGISIIAQANSIPQLALSLLS